MRSSWFRGQHLPVINWKIDSNQKVIINELDSPQQLFRTRPVFPPILDALMEKTGLQMKKLILLLLLWNLNGANAQNLQNSIWLGTNPPSPNLWFKYEVDTLFYSFSGNGNYTALSLFSSAGGQFEIRDLTGLAACQDTGFYTYNINSGNCVFTLGTDLCTSRRNTLTQYTWTFLSSTTGLEDQPYNPADLAVYPNPADDKITIPGINTSTPLESYDATGRWISRTMGETEISLIDVSGLQSGLYLIHNNGRSARLIISQPAR